MSKTRLVAALSAFAVLLPAAARADFVISSDPTNNVTCSAGVCTASKNRAVLNATELMTLLASGDVKLATLRHRAHLLIQAPLFWSSASKLVIHWPSALAIGQPVSIMGTGGLDISTPSEDMLTYAPGASITFWDMSSSLKINGSSYVLADSLAAVEAAPRGRVALAKDYDAAPDGIYTQSAIHGADNVIFDGLGHTISNLTIHDATDAGAVGLFMIVNSASHIHLTNIDFRAAGDAVVGGIAPGGAKMSDVSVTGNIQTGDTAPDGLPSLAGGLAGESTSAISNSFADVTVSGGTGSYVGGLVGYDIATIAGSHASGTVTSGGGAGSSAGGLIGHTEIVAVVSSSSSSTVSGAQYGGGLIGYSRGVNISFVSATGSVTGGDGSTLGGLIGFLDKSTTVRTCFATGAVTAAGTAIVGGLIGENHATIEDCYATGAVSGGGSSTVGGMVGLYLSVLHRSYSTGAVTGPNGTTGGLVGVDNSNPDHNGFEQAYFNTRTSGWGPHHGAGNILNDEGITGLTSAELKAHLPSGFDPSVWTQKPHVNHGWPVLVQWPPH